MTRVGSSPAPRFANEPVAAREPATADPPFRAALRAARKPDRDDEREDSLAAQAQTAERAAERAIDRAERASAARTRSAMPTIRDDDAPGRGGRGDTMPLTYTARIPARVPVNPAASAMDARAERIDDAAAEAAADPAATAVGGSETAVKNAASAAPASGHAPATAPRDDSPVAAWLAAAVGRAFGAFGAVGQDAANATPAAPPPSAQLTAPTGLGLALPALSPLEQAVHDLLGQLVDEPHEGDANAAAALDVDLAVLHAFGATAPVAANDGAAAVTPPARAAALATPPELPSNPSHVHLVLDDGPERVVVTVAMRGNDVHVALRSSDDTTSAALARNAASLDHAMRARGLVLGELTTEREPRDRRRSPEREPDEPPPDAEPFRLEEKP